MSRLRIRSTRQAGALLLFLSFPIAAQSPPVAPAGTPNATAQLQVPADDPSALPSEIMPRASKSLLLDITRTPAGYFVVGERGHILNSSDGQTWTQLPVPTRSTLTALATIDGQLWAGGHDGVIVHSADGGQTWQVQRRDPYVLAPGQKSYDHDPRQGAPILDIEFSDAQNGIAIGAHSLMLVTHDGGATWTSRQAIAPSAKPERAPTQMQGDIFSEQDLQLEEESDPHLNAIVRTGTSTLLIVGERGTVLRSQDNGETWQKIAFPYQGSMFGVLSWDDGRILTYGLRGNVYESTDSGSSWNKIQTQGNVSLQGGHALDNGGAVLVGANGTVLIRKDAASPFETVIYKNGNGETPLLSGVYPTGDGNYVLIGDKGVGRYHPQ